MGDFHKNVKFQGHLDQIANFRLDYVQYTVFSVGFPKKVTFLVRIP